MKRDDKLWVPEPPWWVFSIVGAIVSAWLVVQLMVWLGDIMLDWAT